MATNQSTAPQNSPVDDAPSTNSAPQPAEQPSDAGQAIAEPPKEISPKSVFSNTQPIREEQVQNAVKFLSHPRVKGSPVVHRRNFLEKKGLTKEEIDEAFRRVPDTLPAAANSQTGTYQDAQSMPSSSNQAQVPAQAMQPMVAAPSSVMATAPRRFHWSHAVLAVGFLAVSGAGAAIVFKKSVIPRLKSWVRKVVLDEEDGVEKGKPSLTEETAAAAKTAAAAAADVAKASQEMLITRNEEKKYFMDFVSLLDVQLQEIRTMKNAIAKLEGQTYSSGRNYVREEYLSGSVGRSMMGGRSEYDTRSVRSASPPTAQHPYQSPYQSVSNSSFAPGVKPWELSQPNGNSSFIPQTQAPTEATNFTAQDNGVTYQFNNNGSTPWWEQKNPSSSRITETENRNDPRTSLAPSGTITSIDNPMPRRWVPPQPPPVAMPEAAVAIRQPKSYPPKDVNVNVRAENSADATRDDDEEELQRITQIAESGGQPDMMNEGNVSSEVNPSEIQEEQVAEVVKFEAR